jgi:hypothetical protein
MGGGMLRWMCDAMLVIGKWPRQIVIGSMVVAGRRNVGHSDYRVE